MFPRPSLKTCENCYTLLLNLLSRIYAGLTSKTAYIRMCTKIQILLDFFLTWIWLTCLLAFHMPWDHSDSMFHYPIEEIYKEPFGCIEGMRNWEQENYSPLLSELILEFASLCPLEHFCVLPKISFFCELAIKRWRIEVVEAQVGDSVSSICRCADRGCIHCNLWFYINRNIFSYPIMCI